MMPNESDDALLAAVRATPTDLTAPNEWSQLGALAREGKAAQNEPTQALPNDLWARIERDALTPQATSSQTASSQPGNVVALRRTAPWLLAAAATVGLVVGVVGTLIAKRGSDAPAVTVIQAVQLAPLQRAGTGTAELVRRDGTVELDVTAALPQLDDGYYEVWIIDKEVRRLISLGPVRSDGRYQLPPGVDPSDYPVVDISHEHNDGDPLHSGDSLLRGSLS